MKFSRYFAVVSLLLLAAPWSSAQEKPFYLKEGDRVVFYGDSITDQRLYTTWTETYVVTRFPKLDVSFVHSGWGGDRVTGGGGGPIDRRLRRDVFAYHPSVVTIMLGMNDGSYRAYDEGIFQTYAKGCQHIIDSLKEHLPGVRITLIEPSPFDDVTRPPRFEGGYNQVLVRYSQFVKELAQREDANVADFNAPVVAALEKAKEINPDLATKLIPDRVHPGPAGHLIMAEALLKSWNAPSVATSVEIDAAHGTAANAIGTDVTGIRAQNGLSWDQQDQALPMALDPKDPLVALALKSSDFISSLDQELLKVTGLTAARYHLKIDGSDAGEFSKEQLAAGVNLAELPTPMLLQAQRVHQLTLEHNNLHFVRWRQIQVPFSRGYSEHVKEASENFAKALDEEEAEIVRKQRAAAQPVAHHYELAAQE